MYLNSIKEERIERILADALEDILDDREWLEMFPTVFGYEPLLPSSIEDVIEYPDALYSDDHAIASKAILNPSFHSIMQEIVNAMIFTNIHCKRWDMEDGVEQPGVSFARVLALYNIGYVRLYADFLLSLGNNYAEKFQCYDIVRIIQKWGWQKDTYYLIFAYWFLSKDKKYEVVNFLTANGFSLSTNLENNVNNNIFQEALKSFLLKANFDERDLSEKYFYIYEDLLRLYTFKDNEQMVASFATDYLELINNTNSHERIVSDIEESLFNKCDIPEI